MSFLCNYFLFLFLWCELTPRVLKRMLLKCSVVPVELYLSLFQQKVYFLHKFLCIFLLTSTGKYSFQSNRAIFFHPFVGWEFSASVHQVQENEIQVMVDTSSPINTSQPPQWQSVHFEKKNMRL